jgi:PIN domain nuclease of toxin-antitoxin system
LRILLDTHFAVWLAIEEDRLSAREVEFLADPGTTALFSAISIWELRLKWNRFHQSGDRKGPASPETIHAVLLDSAFEELPLYPRNAAAELAHPMAHRDPFDEMLLVQAQENGLRLFTRDARLLEHPLAISA